jgi:hypothetical protein
METPLIRIDWAQCADGPWWRLEEVDLSTLLTTGVYIIWHEGNPGRVVRVSQGDIAFRLREHRSDPAIIRFRRFGPLRVTWASVPAWQIDAVERYLAEQLKPVIWDRYPIVRPIEVNSPFAA